MAIHSPLLDDVSIQGATSILVNITGPRSLGIRQISRAATVINTDAGAGAHVFLGTVIDESMPEGEIRVTVIATGFHRPAPAARVAEPRQMEMPRFRERQPVATAQEPEWTPAPVREVAPAAAIVMPTAPAPAPVPMAPVPTPVAVTPPPAPAPYVPPIEHAARVAEPVERFAARMPAEEQFDDEPVLDFPEILARGDSVIEFASEPEDADEPVIMDNGSIRSFNTEVFRIPTFVRKQMD
jgi:hypothetical protein